MKIRIFLIVLTVALLLCNCGNPETDMVCQYKCRNNAMDPWQFLYLSIGNILGFGFTIGVAFLVAHYKSKKDRDKIKENLLDELTGIKTLLVGNEDAQVIIHIETPIWNAVVATGNILTMLRENKQFYDKLLVIYNKLSGLRKMEERFSDNNKDIARLRKEILNKIDEVPHV